MSTWRADEWRDHGEYFSWRPANASVSPVEIFHVEMGDPEAPLLLLIHGWPTSSFDWSGVAGKLSARFRVCALDFPGSGFSDKPQGWGYSLARDEELIEFYLAEVIGANAGVIVAHDRGDSVALLHAARCAHGRSVMRLEHLVLSNGNIFLPLSNLTAAQQLMLDEHSWPEIAAVLTASGLAAGLGASMFTPPRAPDDPEVEALSAIFTHEAGIKVLHETIQYLTERAKAEQAWLAELSETSFPVTMIWGLCDTVAPPRVASYVWTEYLMRKPGSNRLYFIPDANHYLQVDRPDAVIQVIDHALRPADGQQPGPLDAEPGAPILVDSSRARLPTAADLLRPESTRPPTPR
ncbi:MAG TPA: alpha/beta hydrolase [Streptosporangiaceae bacterium]|nr:alpha/beta hydrolase [Streptosporangiaceae bacterium]